MQALYSAEGVVELVPVVVLGVRCVVVVVVVVVVVGLWFCHGPFC